VGLIVHSGDDKSAGGDPVHIDTAQTTELWLVDGHTKPFLSEEEAVSKLAGSLSFASAHWCAAALLQNSCFARQQ
jgi:hypothetical protein